MHPHVTPSRRTFLRSSVAAGAAIALPTIVSSTALGRDGAVAPSERITLGVIGIGPRCTYDLTAMMGLPDVQCVAIADVQESRRVAGKKLVDEHYGNQSCALYRDMRELLDRKDIDAVIVATGDRWHAPASILAAQAGKDVYSEKPCGITIEKCQQLADTIEKTGRVFQAGTQRRSVPNFRQAIELAHTGKLGKLHTLYASIYTPTLGNDWLPAEPAPSPEVCDWNLWLGPAPWRPYNKQYVAGGWRGLYDFDSGARVLDWGAHTLDLCQWANQSDDTIPIKFVPGEKDITAYYANGVKLVMVYQVDPFKKRTGFSQHLATCPVRFEGDEGSVETGDSGEIVVKPESLQSSLSKQVKKVRGLEVSAHARNFFDCVKSRELPICNQQVMRRSHIASHAAALSWILGRTLSIDPVTESFINDPEANQLRSRPERDPWAT